MKTHSIKLKHIRIDGGTQARVAINQAAVDDYADVMTDGGKLPAVVVFFDGAEFWLADGFHRYHAHKKIGAIDIDVEEHTGTQQDAKLFSYGANKSHGLRRTNEDKRKAVLGMLADFSDWSDNRIAKHVGVDHKTVGAARMSHLGNSQVTMPAERKVINKHGTESVMKTASIGKAPKVDAGDSSESSNPSIATARDESDRAPSRPTLKAAPALTQAQQEHEDALADAFGDEDTIETLEREIKVLTEQVRALSSDNKDAEIERLVRLYDDAQRKQADAQRRVIAREQDLTKQARTIARICKAAGEPDPLKIAAHIEAHFRKAA